MRALELLYYCVPRVVHAVRARGNDNYEEHMELLPELCRPDKLSVDVGAKTGMYTRRIVRYSRSTMAFEPTPVLAHLLRSVFRDEATIEPVALSDRTGSTVLRTPFDGRGKIRYGLSTIEEDNRLTCEEISEVRETTVRRRRLDDYALSDVGFIKIDVEGHEMCVLRGARETLVREKPNLLVEASDDHRPGTVAEVGEWCEDIGYRGSFLRGRRLVPLSDFDLDLDQRKGRVENFMFIHEDAVGVERELQALAVDRLG
jgi:FkbM family methyltransferase